MTGRAIALLLSTLLSVAAAQTPIEIPPLKARVTDLSATLSASQRDALERRLAEFEQRKGAQIAVLLVPTTAPEAIEQYAIRVAESWKLGRKGIDDGVLLLVAMRDRALRIEVGYGLEGAIPDAVAQRVIDEVIVPFFKRGDFPAGIEAGVSRLIRLIDGEPLPPRTPDSSWTSAFDLLPLVFILVFVVGGFLSSLIGRLLAALTAGGIVGIVAWLSFGSFLIALGSAVVVFVLVLFTGTNIPPRSGGYGGWRNSGYDGSWTGGYGGGGFGGGVGGGGFGGGGGGFGGGGASGRW